MPKSSIRQYISSIAEYPISVKATYDGEIVGCYIFNREPYFPDWKSVIVTNMENGTLFDRCTLRSNMLCQQHRSYNPLQGIALAVAEQYRGLGIGKKLREYPLSLPYDYIWGAHSKILRNKEHWLKFGRKVYYEDRMSFKTIMPISSRFKKSMFAIYWLQQPNAYTCGPTCVNMVINYCGIMNDTYTFTDLVQLCGCNTSTGTIHTGIENALNAFGISNQRNTTTGEQSITKLNDMLDAGNIFIMRTLIYGCKHWLVVYGREHDEYYISDPSCGLYTMHRDDVFNIWQPRDFDGFFVYVK